MHYDKLKDNYINAETDFWIGDPCYIVPDSHWGPLCENWSSFEKREENQDLPRCYVAEVQHEPTGYVFYTWSTAYGDGSYRLMVDNKQVAMLGVDAGCLSAIPMGLIEWWKKTGDIGDYEDMGHVVSAENLQGELTCHEGDMYWGKTFLPTSGTDEEEEDDPWAECEEEGYFF